MDRNTLDEETSPPPQIALFQLIFSKIVGRCLRTVAELRIPDLLRDGPRTVSELAAATGAHPQSLHRLLRTLASQGVFSTLPDDEPRFALTPIGSMLVDEPRSLHAMALWINETKHERAWENLLFSVLTGQPGFDKTFGKPLFDYLGENPEFSAVFNAAMTSLATVAHEAATAAYDFSAIERLVDVGGGHGNLLITILRQFPHLAGIVFDRPHVTVGAQQAIAAAGLSDRCRAEGGDFFASVPAGADGYILSYVLHDWDDEHASTILRNCRQAMRPEGRLLVVEGVITPDDEPAVTKLLDLEMLVFTSGGRERTEEEFRALFAAAGFRLTRFVPTAGPAVVIEGICA